MDFGPLDKVPLSLLVPLSLQHLFAMFGGTVLVPYLFHADVGTSLFMNGLGTITYALVTGRKVPAFLGSSFAFIAPTLAIMAAQGRGYAAAQGCFVGFGLFFLVMSLVTRYAGTRWIDVLFPAESMGVIVMVIGLELMPAAGSMAGTEPRGLFIAFVTLAVALVVSLCARGFLAAVPVLLAVVAGVVLSLLLGEFSFATVSAAPWISVPGVYAPSFHWDSILVMAPAYLVVFAEHVGHLAVTSRVVGEDLMRDPGLHISLLGDGISNVLSGLVGATPNTTYGENIGVMALTKVCSSQVVVAAASISMAIAFSGKVK